MHISTFDISKDIRDSDFQGYLEEKRVRQDLEKLTVEDFIGTLLDTIDKDTTVDMIEQNLISAVRTIQDYKTDRVKEILWIKSSWDFKKEQERKQKTSKTVEVKT